VTSERENDRGDRHDSRPQDDNKARPVTVERPDKQGNGRQK
jgi:hypothetical protein